MIAKLRLIIVLIMVIPFLTFCGGENAIPPLEVEILPPGNLTISVDSSSQLTLLWTCNAGNEDGFAIERSLLGNGPFELIATLEEDAVRYSDYGLTPDTQYFYRVRAFNEEAYSDYSPVVAGTTNSVPQIPPARPTGLTATALSDTEISLSWTDNADNESGFEVERAFVTYGPYERVDSGNIHANAVTFTDEFLNEDTTYYYRVRAFNDAGHSEYSHVANAKTDESPPIVVESVIELETCLTMGAIVSIQGGALHWDAINWYPLAPPEPQYLESFMPGSHPDCSITDTTLTVDGSDFILPMTSDYWTTHYGYDGIIQWSWVTAEIPFADIGVSLNIDYTKPRSIKNLIVHEAGESVSVSDSANLEITLVNGYYLDWPEVRPPGLFRIQYTVEYTLN